MTGRCRLLQAQSHGPIQDQRDEAQAGVGADALGQPVIDGSDLDLALEHSEAALDVGQRLVARDGFGGGQIGGVGDQRELAIEEFGVCYRLLVHAPAEAIGLEVGLDEAGEFGLGDGADKSAVGTAVGGAPTARGLALVLGIEFGNHLLGPGLEFGNAVAPAFGLLLRAKRIMGDDQAVPGEGRLGEAVLAEGETAEGIHQLGITARWHGQNELQPAAALVSQGGQIADVLKAQQPAVGHEDDALDGEALQHCRQHGLQRLRLGDVAGVDGVHQREALGGLHHAENELPGDAAHVLVHAEGAQIISDLRGSLDGAPANNNADKTILSKTVARALLAKVYADKQVQNPDSVIYFADQVFADGISLVNNYSDLFGLNTAGTDAKVRNSSESILEMQYFTGSGNWVTWMFGRDLLDFDFYFTWAKWVTPSRDLIKAFDDAGDMKRKNESIVYYQTTWSNYYDSKNYPFMYKCRSNVNSIIKLRGADILLLKAEALARKNQVSQAAQVVNTVRKRVNLPDLTATNTSSKENLLDAILLERRLELAFEGQRWFDLIRFDKLESIMNTINQRDSGRLPQGRAFTKDSELLPIPQPVLDENTNLVQNPGY